MTVDELLKETLESKSSEVSNVPDLAAGALRGSARRRQRSRLVASTCVLGLAGLLVAGFIVIASNFQGRATPVATLNSSTQDSAAPVMATVTIGDDSNSGQITFSSPGDSTPLMSPSAAWATFIEHSAVDPGTSIDIPPGLNVQLGRVTQPIDLQTDDYRARNRLAYGFSDASECTSDSPENYHTFSCTQWTFLDADTGDLIVGISTPSS